MRGVRLLHSAGWTWATIGIGLVALAVVCVAVSSTRNAAYVGRTENYQTFAQETGNSIGSFTKYFPSGEYYICVTYFARSTTPQYWVFTNTGNKTLSIWLNGTSRSIEWQKGSNRFQIDQPGIYEFILYGADPDTTSSMTLDSITYTDNYTYRYPYVYLSSFGGILFIVGITFTIVGTVILEKRKPPALPQVPAPASIYCPHCGAQNEKDAVVCWKCRRKPSNN